MGAQICAELRRRGFDVTATDVAGTETVLDVTDAAACRTLAEAVDPLVWVNNAAVLGAGDAASQPDDEVDRIITTNLLGTIHGTRAAVSVMRRHRDGRGRGHIINIGSLASWVPVPGETVYAASKAGLLSFTLGLRAELRTSGVTGVELSVVCPDGMLTPMIVQELDNPAIAMSFSGPRTVEPRAVAARAVGLLDRPRAVVSVPRWRGAQVRALSAVPDYALPLAGLFARLGSRNQAKVRAEWA